MTRLGITSITIKKEVRERIGAVGTYEENMNDILTRLLDFYECRKTEEIIKEKSV